MYRLMDILKPLVCYKHYYVIEKFDSNKCKCILKCKFPPPKELAPVKVPNEILFKYYFMKKYKQSN